MTTDFRNLITRMANELDKCQRMLLDDCTVTHRLSDEARAALAQPEPEVVGVSDEELREPLGDLIDKWCQEGMQVKPHGTSFPLAHYVASKAYQYGLCKGRPATAPAGEVAELVAWLRSTRTARLTRAAELLQRMAPVPAPPADGEVAELVGEIRHFLAGYKKIRGLDPEHIYSIHRGDKMEAHITVSRLTRAAELLQRQATAYAICERERLHQSTRAADLEVERQAVAVSEGPWEREGWCDELGRCWWGTPGYINSYTVAQSAQWRLSTPDDRFGSELLCLPVYALPVPEVSDEG